jgi:hypothetical protein
MSPSIIDEPQLATYKFQDANDFVIITLYSNGAYEVKDIDVIPETDSLEIRTPGKSKIGSRIDPYKKQNLFILGDEVWKFKLYEHIYSDECEVTAEINEMKTKTTIELRLYKQQKRTTWPQLNSFKSVPITPQPHEQNVDMIDQQIHSSIPEEEEPYELSTKKLEIEFSETDYKATAYIPIKQVYSCQVQFTETNFTISFYTKFENLD